MGAFLQCFPALPIFDRAIRRGFVSLRPVMTTRSTVTSPTHLHPGPRPTGPQSTFWSFNSSVSLLTRCMRIWAAPCQTTFLGRRPRRILPSHPGSVPDEQRFAMDGQKRDPVNHVLAVLPGNRNDYWNEFVLLDKGVNTVKERMSDGDDI